MIIIITRGAAGGGIALYLGAIVTILTALFCLFGLPVIAYFVYIKDSPSLILGLSQSIPLLFACAVFWFLTIFSFCKYVLKKDILKTVTLSLTSLNRFVRLMLILSLVITLIVRCVPSAPLSPALSEGSEALFGGLLAYNLIFSVLETLIEISADNVSKKALFSLLIALAGASVIGAVAMEISGLRNVLFETVALSASGIELVHISQST